MAREHAPTKPQHAVSITIVLFGDAVCDVRVCEQNHVHDMRLGAPRGGRTSRERWQRQRKLRVPRNPQYPDIASTAEYDTLVEVGVWRLAFLGEKLRVADLVEQGWG